MHRNGIETGWSTHDTVATTARVGGGVNIVDGADIVGLKVGRGIHWRGITRELYVLNQGWLLIILIQCVDRVAKLITNK